MTKIKYKIKLSKGYYALVDEEWYIKFKDMSWHCCVKGKPYAVHSTKIKGKIKHYKMHRLILDAKPGQLVDHINGNSLDNRLQNLRITDYAGNSRNRNKSKKTLFRYKGIAYKATNGNGTPRKNKWQASICVSGKAMYLGNYPTQKAAAKAYDKASLKFHGEFGNRNFND